MGPKLTNCSKPEQVGKRIQTLEDGRVPAKEAKNWRIEGQKRRITRRDNQRLVNKFDMEGFMAQKGLWNLPGEKILGEKRYVAKGRG